MDRRNLAKSVTRRESRDLKENELFLKKLAHAFILVLLILAAATGAVSCLVKPVWKLEFHAHFRCYRVQRAVNVRDRREQQIRQVTEVHFGPFALSSIDQRQRAQNKLQFKTFQEPSPQ